jgi:hypothetical protein
MIGMRSPLLLVVLLCGALVAGCGSSSSSTTSASTSTTTSATTATPPTPTTSTSPSTTASGAAAAGVSRYVAVCKSIIEREPTLSASVKAKVESICNKAADGDLQGARAAAKEVCVEVINASPIPAAAKAQALKTCKAN